MINRLKEWRPDRSTVSAIDLIFYKINTKELKGNTIKELVSSLSNEENADALEYYYQQFRKEGETTIRNMIDTRDKLLDQLTQVKPLFDSKILATTKEDMEKKIFMLK